MTDEAKALVEQLRRWEVTSQLFGKAADLIETQAREIERLHGALKQIAAPCIVRVGTDKQNYQRWRDLATERVDFARAALGESSDH
ncbi:hypothetical protein ACQKOE_13695 [Novosphingobium sp. NPDC080210]|uniref:hypothetical protein n=1 Tax=Novosphingobium sp. NPDC080210 TaxID=3390596 RepID=UPI003CFEFE2F